MLRNGDKSKVFIALYDMPFFNVVKGRTYLQTSTPSGFILEEVVKVGSEDIGDGVVMNRYESKNGQFKHTIYVAERANQA